MALSTAATTTAAALRTEIARDADALAEHAPAWDEIAVAASAPYGSPAWMLAWWRHARPRDAVLRTILVFEGRELVGVAPLFAQPAGLGTWRYRILGARCSSRVDVVVRPDAAHGRVAAAIAAALSGASPACDMLLFDGVADTSRWPALLAGAWPSGRPVAPRTAYAMPAPVVSVPDGDFDAWYASKSKNFRQQFRRRRRQLDAAGAVFRLVRDPAELAEDIAEFARLHRMRWDPRGGSRVLTAGVERMLLDVARELTSDERFRLSSIEIEGRSISSHICLSAGDRTTYWLGGFDDAWAKHHPAMLALLAAVEHDAARGGTCFDLGTGDQPYKSRLATGVEQVRWVSLARPGLPSGLARLQFAPRKLRLEIARRLPEPGKRVARSLMARIGRSS